MTQLNILVGLSVSDPPDADLQARGLFRDHVAHGFIDLTRQLLAGGANVAYGGRFREKRHPEDEDYLEALVALLHTYSQEDRPATERVRQYFGAPAWDDTTTAERAKLAAYMTTVPIPAPDSPAGAEKAAAYRAMREQMAKDIDARVVLGGRVASQSGRWPGIVEEAALSIQAGDPVFVLGGLGGAAACVAAAVRGDWPDELTADYRRKHTDTHAKLEALGEGWSEDELGQLLSGAELNNGLDADDNATLMTTTDLDLMVALVLRGLWERFS